MVKYLSQEQKWLGNVPPTPPGDEAYGGRPRVIRATIALDALTISSSQTAGGPATVADTISLGRVPAGYRFRKGTLTSSISLGTSTIAIGNATTPGKYRAAAVFTAVDTPTPFGTAAAMAAAAATADEELLLTIATASLPNTGGARLVVDMEFVGP